VVAFPKATIEKRGSASYRSGEEKTVCLAALLFTTVDVRIEEDDELQAVARDSGSQGNRRRGGRLD
jgi:hypothetical protein